MDIRDMRNDDNEKKEDNLEQENNLYGEYEKNEEPQEEVNNNDDKFTNNDDNFSNTKYEYKEKEYKTNSLEENTTVTKSSKVSKLFLYSFYLIFIIIGAVVFFMLRNDKYQFYLKDEEINIFAGSTYQVELIPKDIRYFDYLNYNYSVADESVATVDEYGTVTGVGAGSTTLKISISPGFISKTMKINSEAVSIESIALKLFKDDNIEEGSTIYMSPDESILVKAIVNDRNDLSTNVKYTSSDTDIATVDSFGNVTAKKEGRVTITGTRDNIEGRVEIVIKKSNSSGPRTDNKTTPKPVTPTYTPEPGENTPEPSNNTPKPSNNTPKPVTPKPNIPAGTMDTKYVKVSTNNIVLNKGKTAKVKISVRNATGSLDVVSNDSGIAKVSESPLWYDAVDTSGKPFWEEKEITITAGKAGTTYIVIKPNEESEMGTWDPKPGTTEEDYDYIQVTGSYTIQVTVNDQNQVVTPPPTTLTPTSNPTTTPKATIKPTTTPKTSSKPTATAKPTTKPTSTPKPSGPTVSLGISQTTKYVGETIKLKATVSGVSGNYTVTWESSKPSVATVDKNGLVTAKSAGTAVITAKVNGAKGQCNIIVKAKPAATATPKPTTTPKATAKPTIPASTMDKKYVKVSTQEITVAKGKTAKFKVSVYNATGQLDVTSSKTSIAKVDETLLWFDAVNSSGKPFWEEKEVTVTGVAKGTTYIVIKPNGEAELGTWDPKPGTKEDDFNYIKVSGSHTILVTVN